MYIYFRIRDLCLLSLLSNAKTGATVRARGTHYMLKFLGCRLHIPLNVTS